MAKKYNKSVKVRYEYVNLPDSEKVVDRMYDSIFSQIIQRQKQLKNFFRSDEYKEIYKQLCKRKSILVDYLSIH